MQKGRVGQFEYWLVGKMSWQVRRGGRVLSSHTNQSDCFRKAQWFYNMEKAGMVDLIPEGVPV